MPYYLFLCSFFYHLLKYNILHVQKYIMYQFSSVTQSCQTLGNPMDCSIPGLLVHCQLPELTQTHVRWVGDAIQPSHPLSSPSPPAPNLSQHQGLFKLISWPKYTYVYIYTYMYIYIHIHVYVCIHNVYIIVNYIIKWMSTNSSSSLGTSTSSVLLRLPMCSSLPHPQASSTTHKCYRCFQFSTYFFLAIFKYFISK